MADRSPVAASPDRSPGLRIPTARLLHPYGRDHASGVGRLRLEPGFHFWRIALRSDRPRCSPTDAREAPVAVPGASLRPPDRRRRRLARASRKVKWLVVG